MCILYSMHLFDNDPLLYTDTSCLSLLLYMSKGITYVSTNIRMVDNVVYYELY